MIIPTVITLSSVAAVAGHSYSNFARSSFVNAREGYALIGHVVATHVTRSLLSCAQLCLAHCACLSFNFETSALGNGSICELNSEHVLEDFMHGLQRREGCIFGQWTNVQLGQYTFTSLGSSGPTGPTNTIGYKGTPLEGKVQLDRGIQHWRVPLSGTYTIEVLGASGANGTCSSSNYSEWRLGGLGASVKGTFYLHQDTQLLILVGQAGLPMLSSSDHPGGGGGGTFVVQGKDIPLIIAGGGGGGGISKPHHMDGDPGQISGGGSRHGGCSGAGGTLFDPTANQSSNALFAGSGAGLLGDGETHPPWTSAAESFLNGGAGGKGVEQNGGFGGGGLGMSQGGGGGGYSGGGVIGDKESGIAGGGGSYNAGRSQENVSGVNKGDGLVLITHMT